MKIRFLVVMILGLALSGCAAYIENRAKVFGSPKPPLSDKQTRSMDYEKDASAKGSREVAFRYMARCMAMQELPDMSIYSCKVLRAVFADAITGGGINQDWLDSLMMAIREFKPDIIVKTSPRRYLTLMPDPSVHLSVIIGNREQGFIIAPGYYNKIIMD